MPAHLHSFVVPTDGALRQREKGWSDLFLKYSTNQTDDKSEYGGSDLLTIGNEAMDSEPESVSPEKFVDKSNDDDDRNGDKPMDMDMASHQVQVDTKRDTQSVY